MTLQEAFSELIETPGYKDVAKQKNSLGGKYRLYLSRFKKGKLKSGAMVEILLVHGYEVTANKAKRKKDSE